MEQHSEHQIVLLHSDTHMVTYRHGNFQVMDNNLVTPNEPPHLSVCPLCGQSLSSSSYMTRSYFHYLATGSFSPDFDGFEDNNDDLNEGYYCSYFKEIARIGGGAFASVYKADHVLNGVTLGTYAVKKVPIGDSREYLSTCLKEASALCRLRSHPNIITYHHSWLETARPADFGPPLVCLFLLMDYANGGSMDEIIFAKSDTTHRALTMSESDVMSDDDIQTHFMSLVSGVRYLHSIGLLHRDLKPQNLLLATVWDSEAAKEISRLVITDFGLTTDTYSHVPRTGASGTVGYMAPELLVRDVDGELIGEATEKSDVFSMGVILYAMLYGCLPWDSCVLPSGFEHDDDDIVDQANIIKSFVDIHIPREPSRPDTLKSLVWMMMQRDPDARPSVAEIQLELRRAKSHEKHVRETHEKHVREKVTSHHTSLLFIFVIICQIWMAMSSVNVIYIALIILSFDRFNNYSAIVLQMMAWCMAMFANDLTPLFAVECTLSCGIAISVCMNK